MKRALLLSLALFLAAAAPAAASSISVSPTSVPAGGTVTVSGSVAGGCSPGGQVTLTSKAFSGPDEFAGVPAVTTGSMSNGAFSVSAQVASGTAPGSYTVSGRCGGGNFGSTPLQVTAAASGTLPRTGLPAGAIGGAGLCLLLAGAALRRRLRVP